MQNFATKFITHVGFALSLILQIIISITLTCLVGPIFLVVWLINELVRQIVSLILFIQFGDKIHLVPEGADNIWHYKKEGSNRIVPIMAICTDPIDLEVHRKLFLSKVINHQTQNGSKPYEKLKKTFIQKYGYHCFKEDNFDIKNHVVSYQSSEEGQTNPEFFTEEDLLTKILPELSKDMDESKPQWEEVIIPRLKLKDNESIRSAKIFRYHHGFMDGASVLLMWANCMTEGGHKEFPYPVDPCAPLRRSSLKTIVSYLFCFIMAAWTVVKSIYIGSTVKNRFVTDKYSGKRLFGWSEKLDAEILRKIKLSTKVSLPTILAASTGSTLWKMNAKFPSRKYNAGFVSKLSEDNVAIGLVSALLPYEGIRPKNQFTVTHFPLATGDMSWYQRIRVVNKEIIKLAWDPAVYLNNFMFRFFGRFPASVVQAMMENGGNPLSFSNVPMTNREITLWGNQVVEGAGWPPLLTNTGLGICTIRYGAYARFCCIADEACLSAEELQFFLSQVIAEIRLMAEECCNPIHQHNQLTLSDKVANEKIANQV